MTKRSLRQWMRHQMGDDIEPTPAWIRWGLGIAAFLAVLKLLGII